MADARQRIAHLLSEFPTASNLNVPDPRVVLAAEGFPILMPRTVADELRPRVRNSPLPSPS